jgi:hypothetical protein
MEKKTKRPRIKVTSLFETMAQRFNPMPTKSSQEQPEKLPQKQVTKSNKIDNEFN